MAKKKTGHLKPKTHHRRVSGIGVHKKDLLDAGFKFVGLLAGANMGTVLQRIAVKIPPKAMALGQFVLGYGLSRQKHPFLVGAGYGIASAGAIAFSHDMGWIHGIEDMVSGIMEDRGEQLYLPPGGMNGWGSKAAVSEDPNMNINGWGSKAAVSGDEDNLIKLYPSGQGWS